MIWISPRFVNSWMKQGHAHMVSYLLVLCVLTLLTHVQDVPDAVKLHVLSLIRTFLVKQVE